MKNKFLTFTVLVFSLFTIRYSLFAREALAVCPICTVTVAGGLGLSRWLGIDNAISGIWIGGLILSSSLWLIDWLKKKSPKLIINHWPLAIILVMYLLVLGPLAWTDLIGHPFNRLWGIDKLIVGTAVGTLAFWAGIWADNKIRKIKGKQLFNYQKIVFPVVFLIIISLALNILVS